MPIGFFANFVTKTLLWGHSSTHVYSITKRKYHYVLIYVSYWFAPPTRNFFWHLVLFECLNTFRPTIRSWDAHCSPHSPQMYQHIIYRWVTSLWHSPEVFLEVKWPRRKVALLAKLLLFALFVLQISIFPTRYYYIHLLIQQSTRPLLSFFFWPTDYYFFLYKAQI